MTQNLLAEQGPQSDLTTKRRGWSGEETRSSPGTAERPEDTSLVQAGVGLWEAHWPAL